MSIATPGETSKRKLPHYLKGAEYSNKKKRTIWRTHLILRVLAKNKPLSIYALKQKLREEEGEYFPRPRLIEYLKKLRKNGLIVLIGSGSGRKEKIYALKPEVVDILYFQHFLTKSEYIGIIEAKCFWARLFIEMGFKHEVWKIVEEQISSQMISFLASLHSVPRIQDVTLNEVRHIQATRYRDIDQLISSRMLEKVVENPQTREKFFEYVLNTENPILLLKMVLESFVFKGMIEELDSITSKYRTVHSMLLTLIMAKFLGLKILG